jgi:membrane-associated protein
VTTLALGPSWLDPNTLISDFGLIGILIVVFAESGLLIGFFLPGDSLLFTTGLLVSDHHYLKQPLWMVAVLVAVAAVLGDQVGYMFGRKVGPSLFRRPDSRLFKQENIEKAHEFFESYGPRSILMARFVPIVRTFTPIIAGVSRMDYRTFSLYNFFGGTLWAVGVTILGYFLGQVDFVRTHIEFILVAVVLVSILPMAFEVLRARRKNRSAGDGDGDAGGPGGGGASNGGVSNGGAPKGAAPQQRQRGRHRAGSH